MRSSEVLSLPTPNEEYDEFDERVFRRAIEQYLQDLRTDIIETRDSSDSAASLAGRRKQFLLMGANNG